MLSRYSPKKNAVQYFLLGLIDVVHVQETLCMIG